MFHYKLPFPECPQEKAFPREHCRVFPVVRLSFCEGKNLFPHWCLSEKAVFKFLFPTKNSNDPDFYLILDFNKETHSQFPARLVSFLIQLSAAQNVLISCNFLLCGPLSHPFLHNLVRRVGNRYTVLVFQGNQGRCHQFVPFKPQLQKS